jgi:hypothetical protein
MWRLSKGYRLCPWRSPYLRWRIETYCGLHADSISPRDFWRFTWHNRRELVRFLKWADKMDARVNHDN